MNPAQLLAIDTILPCLLGIGGLLFIAADLWPRPTLASRDRLSGALLSVAGLACLGASIWLWLNVLGSQGQAFAATGFRGQVPPGFRPSASSAAAKPSASAGGSTAPVVSANPAPASVAPASSSPAASASASASAASSSAAGAAPTTPPAPTPTVSLAPVAAATFAPDTGAAHGLTVAVQSFEHGFMIYRSDTTQIYVLTDDHKFKVYPDTWDESQPDLGNLTPVAGKYRPGRGFGKLWNADPDVRQALGLALSTEQGMAARVMPDTNSVTLQADATYVFNKDGTWTLK